MGMLSGLDVGIVAAFLLSVVVIGTLAAKRASKSAEDFFLSGRSMPWWLLGVSMVACTFSCDTPNLVTDLVRQNGVAGNWAWWAFLLTGMLTVFVYAKLWRRSALSTDLGFYEIRYAGTPAKALRGFRAVYLGLVFNIIVMGTVSLAAIKIGAAIFGISPLATLAIALTAVGVYATLGGLTGSIWADFYQYTVAMVGAVAAAYFAIDWCGDGGNGGTLATLFAKVDASKLALFPATSDGNGNVSLFMTVFILPIAVQWWATWYPGAEPGGGGYIAQRMLSAKDEKNAVGAVMLFNFLHYALRSWPWLVVALASLVIFPMSEKPAKEASEAWLKAPEHAAIVKEYKDAEPVARRSEKFAEVHRHTLVKDDLWGLETKAFRDKDGKPILDAKQKAAVDKYMKQDIAYPAMIAKLPVGWLGLVVASLIAAYMSTIATHLNWGASYLVQDFYTRFVNPNASPKKQVLVGRLCMLTLLLGCGGMALILENAKGGFDLMLQIGAGTGLIYILRWFWPRLNAWSEISAMFFSFLVACFFQWGAEPCGLVSAAESAVKTGWLDTGWRAQVLDVGAWKLVLGVLVTTVCWLVVTFMTPKEPKATLDAFDKLIHADLKELPMGVLCMVFGCLAVWTCLFGCGYLIYAAGGKGGYGLGAGLLAVSAVSTFVLMKLVGRTKMS